MTSTSPHILLLGANGQVGRALLTALEGKARVTAATRNSSPAYNLAEPDQVAEQIKQLAPDIVINAAAYTAVDKAESESELAYLVNGQSPGRMAEACAELDIPLIHYSTDYVFDGSKTSPYTEEDLPCPINEYGRSKLAGEQAIQDSGCQHYIFRTSWVYDAQGQNFLKTMLRLASERDSLNIIDDQHGSPTWAGYIAQETLNLVEKLIENDSAPESGIYHLTCSGSTSWYGFAKAIFDKSVETGILAQAPNVSAINTEEYPKPAKRPLYSVLSNQKAKELLGTRDLAWQNALDRCMNDLKAL